MTGFGKSETICKDKRIHVEVKSLNSKNMDISTRLAPIFMSKDLDIRTLVSEHLLRGKADVILWLEDNDAQTQGEKISSEVVGSYIKQIREISRDQGIEEPSDWWKVLSSLPIIQPAVQEELSEEMWTAAKQALVESLEALKAFRRQEGKAVEQKFEEKLQNITLYLNEVKQYENARVTKIREQLETMLKQLPAGSYDSNRLEQEMIYYIEKLDINEEKQRLTNHINYFRETMAQDGVKGKKLGFIAQEMGREINTLGSKSNQAEMQNLVVKMKDELEQIKEQVLNVL
jgi:uncharacterized protein (TIGR00255 family)